jgi:sulfoxide reductase heme-binding subunit YedZ
VYVAALLGVVHYAWGVKADLRGPLLAGAVLALLLGLRLWWWRRRSRRAGAPARAAGPAQAQATAIWRGPR